MALLEEVADEMAKRAAKLALAKFPGRRAEILKRLTDAGISSKGL